jgi:hypothetical protein
MICEPTRFSSNHAAHIRLSIRRHAATATYVLVNSIGAGLFGIANQFGSQWSVAGQIPDWQAGWYIYIAQAGVPSGQYMHWGYSITRFFGGD